MAGWVLLEKNRSESGSGVYDLRRGGDGVLYCTCRGWVSNKSALRRARREHLPAECKHTKGYVSRTGASYGPQYEVQAFSGPQPVPQPVPQIGKSAKPAPKNWREVLLAEQRAAEARGMQTPAEALAEFRAEVGRFANLDVGESEVEIPVARTKRALDVE